MCYETASAQPAFNHSRNRVLFPSRSGHRLSPASFEATVSGAIDTTLEGEASFVNTSSGPMGHFSLNLSEDRETHIFFESGDPTGALPVGTYSIRPRSKSDKMYAWYEDCSVCSTEDVFEADSGALVITRSTEDRLKGRFEFTAERKELQNERENQLRTSGTFDAEGVASREVD